MINKNQVLFSELIQDKHEYAETQFQSEARPIYEKDSHKSKIFIILAGHASLYMRHLGKDDEYTVRTLFPGDAIGDGPLAFDTKPGSIFTLKTETECDILSIGKERFQEILVNDFLMISDLKNKMTALKNQIIFSGITDYSLMTLANYIEIKTFCYGDVIFSQDEIPKYFYIMMDGNCKTVLDTQILTKKTQRSALLAQRRADAPPFKCGLRDYTAISKPLHLDEQGKWEIKQAGAAPMSGNLDGLQSGSMSIEKAARMTTETTLMAPQEVQVTEAAVQHKARHFLASASKHQAYLLEVSSLVSKRGNLHVTSVRACTRLIFNSAEFLRNENSLRNPEAGSSLAKPPLGPNQKVQRANTSEFLVLNKEMTQYLSFPKQILYQDGRVIVSAEGDKSTFDDFDWGQDLTEKSGLGSSMCHRVLLQDEPLKKQIARNYEFYLKIVGGHERLKQYEFEQNQIRIEEEKAQVHKALRERMAEEAELAFHAGKVSSSGSADRSDRQELSLVSLDQPSESNEPRLSPAPSKRSRARVIAPTVSGWSKTGESLDIVRSVSAQKKLRFGGGQERLFPGLAATTSCEISGKAKAQPAGGADLKGILGRSPSSKHSRTQHDAGSSDKSRGAVMRQPSIDVEEIELPEPLASGRIDARIVDTSYSPPTGKKEKVERKKGMYDHFGVQFQTLEDRSAEGKPLTGVGSQQQPPRKFKDAARRVSAASRLLARGTDGQPTREQASDLKGGSSTFSRTLGARALSGAPSAAAKRKSSRLFGILQSKRGSGLSR